MGLSKHAPDAMCEGCIGARTGAADAARFLSWSIRESPRIEVTGVSTEVERSVVCRVMRICAALAGQHIGVAAPEDARFAGDRSW